MWHRFNPNPRGSSVGDCAVRAVAAATGQSWEQAYIALALTGYALGDMPSANRTWGAYLQKRGFKRRMVEADCTTCYTVSDFAREYPRGVYVLGCSGHVLAVVNAATFAVGWLLVEDLVMVLVLVLLPATAVLLGGKPLAHAATDQSIWITLGITLLKVAGFIAFMLIIGKRLVPMIMQFVARLGSRELFTLTVVAALLFN